MMLFRAEEEAHSWSLSAGRPDGRIVGLDQLARLARAWYGDRLDPEWRPRTTAESQEVLTAAGLVDPFWSLTRTTADR
jgi:hypothetical protein